jgi:hypothetical protein
MRERDGLDYLLVLVVAGLAVLHVPPVRVIRREAVELARETGVAGVLGPLLDVRVAVVALAVLGLVIVLVLTDSVSVRK